MYTKAFLAAAVVLAAFLPAPALAAPSPAPGAGPGAASGAAPGAAPGPKPGATALGACGPGRLCLWPKPDFKGKATTYELATTDIESCVVLPAGASAQSFANRTGRPVTTYQSAECAETGEFDTYPGKGTWVPQAPYEVRAVKLWER